MIDDVECKLQDTKTDLDEFAIGRSRLVCEKFLFQFTWGHKKLRCILNNDGNL